MRRQMLVAALVGTLALVGCSSTPSAQDSTDDTQQQESQQQVEEQAEPEQEGASTASAGEPVEYLPLNADGRFLVTVDGLEKSSESTSWSAEFDDIQDGYSDCYLMLTIENDGVDTSASNTLIQLSKIWLEDDGGVTMNPASIGYSYGEYGSACDFTFNISEGQTVRIAVPYQLPDSGTSYTLIIDGTEVPVTVVDGNRPLS